MKVTVQPTNVCLNTPGFIFHGAEVQECSPELAQLWGADSIHDGCPVVAIVMLHPQNRQKGEGGERKRGRSHIRRQRLSHKFPADILSYLIATINCKGMWEYKCP